VDRQTGKRGVEPSARGHASPRDRLRVGCLAAIAGSSVYMVFVCLAFPEAARSIALDTAGLALFDTAIFFLLRLGKIPEPRIPGVGAAVIAAMTLVLLHSIFLIRSPVITVFMALHVLSAGVMHSQTRWLIPGLLLAVGSWLTAGFAIQGASFALPATAVICASVIAMLIHLVLMRYLTSLEELRERDRQHRDELAAALAAAQHELVERQRAEAERERLREQLLHSQKLDAIGTLAGGVAHDMNNALATILGLAELLRESAGAEVPDEVEQIASTARRCAELTRNLLGFSRRGKYRKEPLEPGSVVNGVAALLSRTLPKGIELVIENTADHGIEGDSAQLSQALINLALNASDAMTGQGRLGLQVGEAALAGDRARELGAAEGRYVTIAVADGGVGMSREIRARMFEPFFTTKEQGRGTGLGLAMVYGTITNHGGAIAVESEPGRGTSITIYLPAVARVERAAPAQKPAEAEGGGEPAATSPAPRNGRPVASGTVLVVDDETILRSVTRRALERAGYQVVTACHGADAIERFVERGGEFSVVLLDMAMPVMGGAECFRRLRAMDPRVRVLLASGYALEQEARECLAAGALGFLEKPFSNKRLLEAVARARDDRRLDESFTLPAVADAQ
jgi:two-component system, cell cycle sensor histidine kinase and response regulator CckA